MTMNATYAVPIGILDWSLSPVIDIGDIVAGIALILTPIIFYIGYRRQRNSDERRIKADERKIRSDQLQISLGLMDRVLAKRDRLRSYLDRVRTDETYGHSDLHHLDFINDVLYECDYFGFVIDHEEIDKPLIIRRYRPRIAEIWVDMNIEGLGVIKRLDKEYPKRQYPKLVRRSVNNHRKLLQSTLKCWKKTK